MCTTTADLRAAYAAFLQGPGRPGVVTAADPFVDAVGTRELFEAHTQLRLLVALASDSGSIALNAAPAPNAPPHLRLTAKANIVEPRPSAAWTVARAMLGSEGFGGITSRVTVVSMTRCVTELARALFVGVMERNSTTTAGYWGRVYKQSVSPYFQAALQESCAKKNTCDTYDGLLAVFYKVAGELPNASTLAALLDLDPALEADRALVFRQALYATHLPLALYAYFQRNLRQQGGDYYKLRLSELAAWLFFMHAYQCLYQYAGNDPDMTNAFADLLTVVSNALNDEGGDQMYAAIGQARAVADDNRVVLQDVRQSGTALAEHQRRLLAARDDEAAARNQAARALRWAGLTLALAAACLAAQASLLAAGRRAHALYASAVTVAMVLVIYLSGLLLG